MENVFLNSPLHRLSIVHGRMPWSEATLPMLLDHKLIDSYNLALQMPHTGRLSWEKTSANWWKKDFHGENFHRLLAAGTKRCQIFLIKLSQRVTKPQNSQKFSAIWHAL